MATFQRFEDIEAWQMTRQLTREIYQITNMKVFSRDYGLRDQMRRACVSMMSNIAEGFERNGNREFIHFLSIAKGSSGEIRSQLYIALDQAYIDQTTFDRIWNMADDSARLISGLIQYLCRSKRKGSKYKQA